MTPRQRVLTALSHRQPDRTPRDFWAEEPTWNRLLAHVGHSNRDRLLCDLEIDIRHLQIPAVPEEPIGDGVCQNFWGERYTYQPTPWGSMREDVHGALANAASFSDLETFRWPTPDQFDYSSLASQCARFEQYALLYGFADVWQRPGLVRGWEGMFMDMAERPEWVHFLGRKFTDFYIEDYTRAANATDGRIDLYLLISDLGSQSGPLISPAMFREFVAPYLKEMIDCIHGLGGKVLYHSCGAIQGFIPDLIALGVDLLDPIQPIGPAMAPERLKADFGDRISFHGGIDMQQLLPNGTPEEVRAEANRYCKTLGHRGGYILGPAHLFQPDVPPENIFALYQVGSGLDL
ncbi:MAG: uroporphyrinogen decarboxylase family protein [Pirellulaceae bacterium]